MADIFLSYKSERRAATEHLARMLEMNGYSVWFDYGLLSGHSFARQIERELRAAKAVIVLWCSRSVESDWVNNEARLASRLDKLIPVWIEDVELPLEFNGSETINLSRWDGAPRSHLLDRLFDELTRKIGKPQTPDISQLKQFEAAWRRYGAPTLMQFPLSQAQAELQLGAPDIVFPPLSSEPPAADMRRLGRAGAAAAGLALLAGAAGTGWWAMHGRFDRPPAVASPLPSGEKVAAVEPASSPSPDVAVNAASQAMAEALAAAAKAAEQAERARAQLMADRAKAVLETGDHALAAGLALKVLDPPRPGPTEETLAAASRILFRSVPEIMPPPPEWTVPGLSPGTGTLVTESVFSPDARYFAIRARTPEIRIYDAVSGKVLRTVEQVGRDLRRLAFSGDGGTLIVEEAATLALFPVAEPEISWRWPLTQPFDRDAALVGVSPDGSIFVDARAEKAIAVQDSRTGTPRYPAIIVGGRAQNIAFSPDGRLLTASVDGVGQMIWDSATGKPVATRPLRNGRIETASISRDNQLLLLTVENSRDVIVYDIGRKRDIAGNRPKIAALGGGAFFLADSTVALAIGEAGSIAVWNARTGETLWTFAAGQSPPTNWRVSQDGETLAFDLADGRMAAWRWRQKAKLVERGRSWQPMLGDALLPDGSGLRVVENGQVKLVSLRSSASSSGVRLDGGLVESWAVSPDGSYLGSSSRTGARFWHVPSGRVVLDVPNGAGLDQAPALAISPLLPVAAVGHASEEDGPKRVFSLDNGRLLKTLRPKESERLAHSGELFFSTVMPELLFENSSAQFRLWNADSGEALRTVGFSIKGEPATREQIVDGKTLRIHAITYNHMNALSVIDMLARSPAVDAKLLTGHDGYVIRTRFGTDPTSVFSAAMDRTVRIWNAAEGSQLDSRRFAEGIKDFSLSPDGDAVHVLTGDSSVQSWYWRKGQETRRDPFPDCTDGEIAPATVLCKASTDSRSRRAWLREIESGRIIADVAEESRLLAGGRFVLEIAEGSARLLPAYRSVQELVDEARRRLAPHSVRVEAAIASSLP